jgi:hypothetical protein
VLSADLRIVSANRAFFATFRVQPGDTLGWYLYDIGDRQWVSQAGLYLESAIRLAPKEPFAAEAYVLLEEDTIVGYTGSAGSNLPDSVAKHLEELRALVDR